MQLEVTVHSTNQKLGYAGRLRSLPPIAMDYVPPQGDGEGYLPLELLLMSLASCSGGTVGLVLRKMGKNVSGITVAANGARREEHPTSFRTITLEFEVRSRDAGDDDVRRALEVSEESLCPVWAMMKGNAEIRARHRVVVP